MICGDPTSRYSESWSTMNHACTSRANSRLCRSLYVLREKLRAAAGYQPGTVERGLLEQFAAGDTASNAVEAPTAPELLSLEVRDGVGWPR
jgi:hypothetical protein